LRRLGGVLGHLGHLGHLGWLHIAFWLGILAVLGASWGRLRGNLGASWAVLGRLLGHLGKSRGVWEAS